MRINMSKGKPIGITYPPRPLAEPRSGRYAGFERAAGEVFGCIPNGARAYRERGYFAIGSPLYSPQRAMIIAV